MGALLVYKTPLCKMLLDLLFLDDLHFFNKSLKDKNEKWFIRDGKIGISISGSDIKGIPELFKC